MLCSGDELNLTADADGILILPPGTPLGGPLVDLYGDVVLDVDVKPNRGDALASSGSPARSRRSPGRQVRFPDTDPPESGDPVERFVDVEVRDSALCPRFVGRWVGGVSIGPSPDRVQMRLRAAGVRADQQRRRREQLRDARARQADPHVRRGGVAPRPDGRHRLIVRRAEPGERIETLDHVERTLDPDTLLIADARGPLGIAGVMGDAPSEVKDSTTDVIVESAIFDPVIDPPDRPALRPPLRGQPPVREGPGVPARPARRGPGGAADRGVGRRHRGRRARRHGARRAGTVAGRVPAEPREPAARHGRSRRTCSATLLARVGIETEPDGAADRDHRRGRPEAAHDHEPRRGAPRHRPDLAPRHRDRGRRRRGGRPRPRLRDDPGDPARHADAAVPRPRRSRSATRSARRSPAPASPRSSPTRSCRRGSPTRSAGSRRSPASRANPPRAAARSSSRTRCRRTTPCCGRRSSGSLVEVVSTNLRHGVDDVAIFEIGKGYGADAVRRATPAASASGGGSGSRDRRRRASRLEPARAAVRPRRREGRDRAARRAPRVRRADVSRRTRRAAAPSRAGRPRRGPARWRGSCSPASSASSTRRSPRTGTCAAPASSSPSWTWPAWAAACSMTSIAAPAAALPGERARPRGRRGGGGRRRATSRPRSAPPAGPTLADLRLFDVYRGSPLAADEKSLAYRLTFQAPDRTLEEAEVEAAIAAITAGLSAANRRPNQDLSPACGPRIRRCYAVRRLSWRTRRSGRPRHP